MIKYKIQGKDLNFSQDTLFMPRVLYKLTDNRSYLNRSSTIIKYRSPGNYSLPNIKKTFIGKYDVGQIGLNSTLTLDVLDRSVKALPYMSSGSFKIINKTFQIKRQSGDRNSDDDKIRENSGNRLKKSCGKDLKNSIGLFKKIKSYNDCTCNTTKFKAFYKEKPKQCNIEALCNNSMPYVINRNLEIFTQPYIFIFFEGVVGFMINNKAKITPRAVSFIQKVQENFHIIVITLPKSCQYVAEAFERKKLKYAGIYTVDLNKSKELICFDAIYNDFNIRNPLNEVLVISCLNIEVSKNEPIFPNIQRLRKQLNISMCPVSIDSPPITFLIPHLQLSTSSRPFEVLFESLKTKPNKSHIQFQDWIKEYRIRFRIVRSTLPQEIIMESLPFKKCQKVCRLHKAKVPSYEEIPFNYFVLL
ncbi:hypothetical protein SteCoe_22741 [Stentor coeruleus]|uniref:Uncharacterized protein n=1 Tax=Stentor coeruleus TaxID=5963 RepID=A0A1R2BLI2_9CILI|nr:hypothetical protein SteCoe_22741 [Stentor coeruleus]